MENYTIRFLPDNISVSVSHGTTVLEAEILAGLKPDAPCGGRGSCGKCRVTLEDGRIVSACQTTVDRNMTVSTGQSTSAEVLMDSRRAEVRPDGEYRFCIAFDIGTTTVVGYLSDGVTGQLLGQLGIQNPQAQYGADVISRIQYALDGRGEELSTCIRSALTELTEKLAAQAGISPKEIGAGAIVGNTAMHHLLLALDPRPLVTPPYMPAQRAAMEIPLLPIGGSTRLLPNIAGFVGGDTVGCMCATRFDQLEELTLLIDIGTNGEMVLGDRRRAIACSTAAGPAFEGAKISCGMRGAAGAVDHVTLTGDGIRWHVIGDADPKGICGSGLLDLVAVLLDAGILDESGYLEDGSYTLASPVILTQRDVREVQLAKAAIRAGIELLTERIGASVSDIRQVFLAGAFGSFLDPASACRIGMIPPELGDRIRPIGNAAGEGARLCSLSRAEFAYSTKLAEETEFLELAGLPEFQDRFVDALDFSEEDE